jgi:hypothetical protein
MVDWGLQVTFALCIVLLSRFLRTATYPLKDMHLPSTELLHTDHQSMPLHKLIKDPHILHIGQSMLLAHTTMQRISMKAL